MPKKVAKKKKAKAVEKQVRSHVSIMDPVYTKSNGLEVGLSMFKDWCNVDLRLLNWKYMNFSHLFRSHTTINQICEFIEERHGKINDVRVFLSPPSLKSEIIDKRLTLLDIGFKGGLKESPETAVIYYDFKVESRDALLGFTTNASEEI